MIPVGPTSEGIRLFSNENDCDELPAAVGIEIDLNTGEEFTVNLLKTLDAGIVKAVRSMFVDNSRNSNSITIVIDATGQTIVVPGESQAYLPAMFGTQPDLEVLNNSNTDKLYIQLLNFMVQPFVWSTI